MSAPISHLPDDTKHCSIGRRCMTPQPLFAAIDWNLSDGKFDLDK